MKEKPRCGARRKYDGKPCQAQALPSGRCRLHGGMSTGPKTIPGKIRSLSGLRHYAVCRKEMRAIADALEAGKGGLDEFNRLVAIAQNNHHAEVAARKIFAWANA